jgi:homoserine dehydrogenase
VAHYNLALIGFGNVGKSLARLLIEKENEIQQNKGVTYSVTGIFTHRHGVAINPHGIDLKAALNMENINPLSSIPAPSTGVEFIQRCGADVLFENSPVNYQTGQPAVDHLRTALENGMHAITSNKGPVVHAYRSLSGLAETKGKCFFFESTVMDGCPIFSLFRESLPAAQLIRFKGILNSTTNMILSRMEKGESFDQAVAFCQQIGIAETDPSGDIDGWDAAVKVAALVTVLIDTPLLPQDVDRQGIRAIGIEEIQQAARVGNRWKLVCTAEKTETSERGRMHVKARVAPELVSPSSPLYGVEGTTSIVQFTTDILGELTIIEENPGPHTTAYGNLADFLNAVKS